LAPASPRPARSSESQTHRPPLQAPAEWWCCVFGGAAPPCSRPGTSPDAQGPCRRDHAGPACSMTERPSLTADGLPTLAQHSEPRDAGNQRWACGWCTMASSCRDETSK
jgi:hypothetical protein